MTGGGVEAREVSALDDREDEVTDRIEGRRRNQGRRAAGAVDGIEDRVRPVERFRYLVLAAQREGNRLLAELLRPLGLSPSQAEVLRVLADTPGLSLQQLGRRLVCEAGSPSRLVDGLVDGLVRADLVAREADEVDRRSVRLHLTPTGHAAADAVAAREANLYALLDSALQPADLAAANHALERAVHGITAGEALALREQDQPGA